MAVETVDGGGLSGAEIDSLAPVPAHVLPVYYLLAAYVSAGQTAGARQIRVLMGRQDWRHPSSIVFPTLALALLISDKSRRSGLPTVMRGMRSCAEVPCSGRVPADEHSALPGP
jgi:hypothetical protein